LETQLAALPDDAQIPPSRVLSRHAHHQLDELWVQPTLNDSGAFSGTLLTPSIANAIRTAITLSDTRRLLGGMSVSQDRQIGRCRQGDEVLLAHAASIRDVHIAARFGWGTADILGSKDDSACDLAPRDRCNVVGTTSPVARGLDGEK
jgi:hypothetical protein